jgi:SPP1 gp7 family putative phage head morphogenesis protein
LQSTIELLQISKPSLPARQKRLLEAALARDALPPELARSRWQPTAAERRRLRRESQHFDKVRRAESQYIIQLRKIARHVGDIIRQFPVGSLDAMPELTRVLSRYAEVLDPWARAAGSRMLADVSRRDATAWFKASREIGRYLQNEIQNTPIGSEVGRILEEQVALITSIPIEAGRRVQELTQEYVAGGRRYDDLVPLIQRSGAVTLNRATLIARTETAKAASAITQARAKYVGADTYIWRTARDADVRRAHRRLEGTIHRWDDTPVAELDGNRHHPGEFPNCRCYAEPQIPDVIT